MSEISPEDAEIARVVDEQYKEQGYVKFIFSGVDEFIIETEKNKAEKTLEALLNCMSEAPDWIVDIPLAAEGKVVARYEK